MIEPNFNYCSSDWDADFNQHLSNNLQKLQNRAARIVTKSSYVASAGPILDMLGWDRVTVSRTKRKAASYNE